MHEIFLTLGFGLVAAAILALSAVAFTLEYAVTNVANLSHGEILTIGAYAAYGFRPWAGPNSSLWPATGLPRCRAPSRGSLDSRRTGP